MLPDILADLRDKNALRLRDVTRLSSRGAIWMCFCPPRPMNSARVPLAPKGSQRRAPDAGCGDGCRCLGSTLRQPPAAGPESSLKRELRFPSPVTSRTHPHHFLTPISTHRALESREERSPLLASPSITYFTERSANMGRSTRTRSQIVAAADRRWWKECVIYQVR